MLSPMRAIEARRPGGVEVLELVERAVPEPGPGQYLVRVSAAGVNPIDWKLRLGRVGPLKARFPWVPGCELCGAVERAGVGATRFAAGDRILGFTDPGAGGATAQFALLDDAAAERAPEGLTDEEAAGLAVTGLTALQALRTLADVRAGQSVLVNGAAGGVGHLGVQIARALGARVTAVTGPENVAWAAALGAERVVDRSGLDFRRDPARYDVILDASGRVSFFACRRALAPGGVHVTTVPSPSAAVARAAAPLFLRRARFVILRPAPGDLAFLVQLAAGGRVRVAVDHVYAMAETGAAHMRSESGRVRGKIIVRIGGAP